MIHDVRNEADRTQIDDRAAFDIIRYANCWEDSTILSEALQPAAGKQILSIASAGDNSLDLLSHGARVVAVDLSLPQLASLELRAAAFRHLDYEELLAFLGIHTSSHRLTDYESIKKDLSPSSRAFWDAHPEAISTGIIFAGKFEDYFSHFRRKVIPLIHSRKTIDALLEDKPDSERRDFYDRRWNTRQWQLLFRVFFSRRVMGWLGRDPEFFRYVDGPVSTEILRRAERALKELPTHDNPYLTFILRGNFKDALPEYLKEERYEPIRENLHNLILCRGTVQEAARYILKTDQTPFDGFNLSDIFEYLDEETTRSVIAELLNAAAPKARFAYWNMMVPRQASALFPEKLTFLEDLSRELHNRDRAFFYGAFLVDEHTSPTNQPS